MFMISGVDPETLRSNFYGYKTITIPILSCADNGATLTIRDKSEKIIKTLTISGNFRALTTYPVSWVANGDPMIIDAYVFDSAPPVTSGNPCGIYLYDNYHKKVPTFVSGKYCKAGRAVTDWYNGPGWFNTTTNDNNGKYNWRFKLDIPAQQD